VDKIPVTSLSTSVDKSGLFQIGYQLSDFSWHA
jgi:hypothetical protein